MAFKGQASYINRGVDGEVRLAINPVAYPWSHTLQSRLLGKSYNFQLEADNTSVAFLAPIIRGTSRDFGPLTGHTKTILP
jgi:hypothetical protein